MQSFKVVGGKSHFVITHMTEGVVEHILNLKTGSSTMRITVQSRYMNVKFTLDSIYHVATLNALTESF